ncbi:TSUP family transporter [Erythrobacter sp. JK5]|uniref:TSUP family transporter n=1 Tax=Erythrobacter sp. JK5 TaxID=2829500 RepID=UPI001BA7E497|nr:TSUP family transporter [Erythrobacter sp. JK5]QUL37146.1 sulfite exporter TauE/SafE family protein [Erythrobacter sp. JK5]
MESLAAFAVPQIAVAVLAALGASFVRGLTGFGMAILLVPVLALALSPVEAVMLGNFLSLMIGALEIRRLIREAERTAWAISGIVVLTTPVGLLALAATSADLARLVIALIAFSAFLAILLPRRAAEVPGRIATGAVGMISGLMTGYAGMPGPPVVPYYAGRALPRATIKASMLLIFTIAAGVALLAGGLMGLVRVELAILALALLPVILIGNRLGTIVSGRIGDPVWRSCVGLVLAGAALGALWRLL